jgi:hypothetical protein
LRSGGFLIADNLTGLLTETGRGRNSGVLDDEFGIVRDESKGYLDGKSLTEVDAEYWDKPYPLRLHAYDGSLRNGSMVVFERGTQVMARKGHATYLNMTPLAYEYFPYRTGEMGRDWRKTIDKEIRAAGLQARVVIDEPFIESLLWRNGDRYLLALVKSEDTGVEEEPRQIRIHLALPATDIRNLRTGKVIGNKTEFMDSFNPSEANLYSFSLTR